MRNECRRCQRPRGQRRGDAATAAAARDRQAGDSRTSGAAASFAAEISDPDALVARVEWTFGDGESASDDRLTRNGTALGTAVEHTFTATGTYAIAVSVTVTGGTGNAFTVL